MSAVFRFCRFFHSVFSVLVGVFGSFEVLMPTRSKVKSLISERLPAYLLCSVCFFRKDLHKTS